MKLYDNWEVCVMGYERWSLNAWKNMFKEIYKNQNLPYISEQVLHRLIEETAELVKPILTMNIKDIRWHLADVLAWVCAFATKYNIDLDETMFRKYVEKPPGKPIGQTPLSTFAVISKDRPENLEDWQNLLGYLYRDENENNPPTLMLSRLMQDIGITSRKLRAREDPKEIKDKIVGVLGWTIAIANKFQIPLHETTWNKYSNMCWKCQSKPCKCFKLTTLFISYSKETEEQKKMMRKLLDEFKLKAKVFEKLGPAFRRSRMVEAFNAINESDGAIVLLGKKWSVNVYAELIEILRVLDENNVKICVEAASDSERDPRLQDLIRDIEQFHYIHYYPDDQKLQEIVRNNLISRLRELRALAR